MHTIRQKDRVIATQLRLSQRGVDGRPATASARRQPSQRQLPKPLERDALSAFEDGVVSTSTVIAVAVPAVLPNGHTTISSVIAHPVSNVVDGRPHADSLPRRRAKQPVLAT